MSDNIIDLSVPMGREYILNRGFHPDDGMTIPPKPLHLKKVSPPECIPCARFRLALLKAVRRAMFGKASKPIKNSNLLGYGRTINTGA